MAAVPPVRFELAADAFRLVHAHLPGLYAPPFALAEPSPAASGRPRSDDEILAGLTLLTAPARLDEPDWSARVPAEFLLCLAMQSTAESLLQLETRGPAMRVVRSICLVADAAFGLEARVTDAAHTVAVWALPLTELWPTLQSELPRLRTPPHRPEAASATIVASRAVLAAAQTGRGELVGAVREQLGVDGEAAAAFAALAGSDDHLVEGRLFDVRARHVLWTGSWLGGDASGWLRVRLAPPADPDAASDPAAFAESAQVRLEPASQAALEADLLSVIAGDVRRRRVTAG